MMKTRTRNRIKDFWPEAWEKYLTDELERKRQEAKATTGIDPLAFVPIDAPLPEPPKSPFFTLKELKDQAEVEVQQIISRSRRREARRKRKLNQ